MRLRRRNLLARSRRMDEQKRKAHPSPDTDHHDRARLIRSIVADAVLDLGRDRAMVRDGRVKFGGRSSGRTGPRSKCDPRAILDATSGGDAGRVVPCGNFVCPRPHFYAAAWGCQGSICSSVAICSSVRPSKTGCLQPVARRMRIASRRDGALISPRSRRDMVDCLTPISSASSACVAPRSFRSAEMSITDTHICAYAWVGQ